jgi:hypothetical protein
MIAIGSASAALAVRPSMGGTVVSMNDQSRTFVCRWNHANWTYKTTDRTTYWIGRTKASWYDMRVGSVVRIGFHRIHRERVADIVRIRAPK